MAAPESIKPLPPREEETKKEEETKAAELPSPPVAPTTPPASWKKSSREPAFKIGGSTLQDDLATLLSSPGSADVVRSPPSPKDHPARSAKGQAPPRTLCRPLSSATQRTKRTRLPARAAHPFPRPPQILTCGGDRIKAHAALLAARSPTLAKLLAESVDENATSLLVASPKHPRPAPPAREMLTIDIPAAISPSTLHLLLRYLYTDYCAPPPHLTPLLSLIPPPSHSRV